jgi:FMN-dependent NADH-azoreductase
MTKILHIQASPRRESISRRVAEEFLKSCLAGGQPTTVETLDLFDGSLPQFRAPEAAAKYEILAGEPPQGEAAGAWKRVAEVVAQLESANTILISCPMWNFGIPYPLKQYFDVIVQPGLTFSYSPEEGYSGLLREKTAVLILARGGAYVPGTDTGPLDMQRPYLEQILGFIGVTDIRTVVVEPTQLGGPEAAEEAVRRAVSAARSIAEELKA